MLYAAFGGGLFIYNPEKKTIKKLSVENGLSSKYIHSVYEDHNGRVWLGTSQNEAMIYNAENMALIQLNAKQGLLNNSQRVTALAEDGQGNKWIGMNYFGVNIIQPGGKVLFLGLQQGLQRIENFRSIYKDSRSRIWITDYDGVDRVDLQKGEMKSIFMSKGRNFRPPTYGFLEIGNGETWISNAKGIYAVTEAMDTFKYLNPRAGSSSTAAFMLIKANANEVWAGTGRGISVINTTTGQLSRASSKGLDSANINGLFKDSKGRIWVSSASGIFIIDLSSNTCQHITTEQGLPNDYVNSITEKDGNFFIATTNGLCVLNPAIDNSSGPDTAQASWHLYLLSKPMGFLRADFTTSAMMDRDGTLWWGTGTGLTGLQQLKIDTTVPTTYITGINIMEQSLSFVNRKWLQEKLGDQDTLKNKKTYTKNNLPGDSGFLIRSNISWDSISGIYALPAGLELPYNLNHVTFYFSALPSVNWDQTRFRFILEGADKDWSETTSQPYADYRNLSPGNYRFVVRSKGVNGKWSKPARFEFKVRPPLWKTWWAYTLYILAAIVGVVMFSRYRSRKLIEENVILEEKIAGRTSELHESIRELKATQSQLIQSEKMASLGELTTGIAQEVQNPLIFGNKFFEINSTLRDNRQEAMR